MATRYIPVKRWPEFHPWPSVNGLRFMLFHRKTNGLAKAVVKVGKRVLINEEEFFKWVEKRSRFNPVTK